MQAAKNMAGMIKHKVEDAAATAEEKADIAKAEAEEKVSFLRIKCNYFLSVGDSWKCSLLYFSTVRLVILFFYMNST